MGFGRGKPLCTPEWSYGNPSPSEIPAGFPAGEPGASRGISGTLWHLQVQPCLALCSPLPIFPKSQLDFPRIPSPASNSSCSEDEQGWENIPEIFLHNSRQNLNSQELQSPPLIPGRPRTAPRGFSWRRFPFPHLRSRISSSFPASSRWDFSGARPGPLMN